MKSFPRKLLTIGHSYIVPLNRRLANEMSRVGQANWEITVVSPLALKGDLRPLKFEPDLHDRASVEGIPVLFDRVPHLMLYGKRLREILHQDWDLVHCWEEPYVLSGGQIAWHTPAQAPLVYFTFQNNSKRYPPPFNWIEAQTMQQSAGWIASGHTVANALKHRQGYDRPMQIIPLGVDVEHFSPSPAIRQSIHHQLEWDHSDAPVIGFLGRFVPEKGLSMLMRVLNRLAQPWRAMFVGTGVMEAELRSWAAQYGDRVRICTTVTHDQVPQYLNAMDMLCAPSQTALHWREQFGRMLIEAFACGVPVIGSDSGEIPYVIGDAGIVLGEKDEQAWLRAISTLLDNPTQRTALAERGLDHVHSVYQWSVVARQHLKFFDSILGEKRVKQYI
ncbi:glycosyltransferase family 4 protein [Leptolyngbya sp. FACHB-17]|uniref:glycosyltransferase family 4 protein n=1 Tax=unclassified Leptolyngbya TaxID=2650499 RepID=UPI00167FF948|nr:glycosyltransferase family 4 protein [Leptolyngbya sp. FACHB-17]MBD2081724.1 glycosyltransferase family 4 protein [Leptolyngbya sp. FACHB-17]